MSQLTGAEQGEISKYPRIRDFTRNGHCQDVWLSSYHKIAFFERLRAFIVRPRRAIFDMDRREDRTAAIELI
jgi:hypothetical protein